MSNNHSPETQARNLWQTQKTESIRMSLEQLQKRAVRFERRIRRRNAREYMAAAAVAVFFGFEFARTDDVLVRIGFGLLIAAMAYVCWQLYRRGSSQELPFDAGRSSFLEFQRRELERQRDLVSRVWRWYLGPMIPGLVVLQAAFVRAKPNQFGLALGLFTFYAATFVGIAWLNKNAARKLQREIEELEREA